MSKSTMDELLDAIEWKMVRWEEITDEEIHYVTHEGVLEIAGLKLTVYQLSNGVRVFDKDDLEDLLDAR